MKGLLALASALALVACTATPSPSPSASAAPTATPSAAPTASTAPSGAGLIPKIPDPVAVEVPVKGGVLLVLDLTSAICPPRPSCLASLPKVADLLKKARAAKIPVIYSLTPTAGSTVQPEVAPQQGEPSVTAKADKFMGTNLDQLLKDRAAEDLVIVGSAANGAVLYTAFEANLRGYTVVVAQDGISAEPAEVIALSRWQLLNQPGAANSDNKPLTKAAVTLSTTALITFK